MVQVNSSSELDQQNPHQIVLADGSRVIIWASENATPTPDGTYAIRGQVYDPDGSPVGSEFIVPGAGNVEIPVLPRFEDWDDTDANYLRDDTVLNQASSEIAVELLSDGTVVVAYSDDAGFGTDTGDTALVATTINIDVDTGIVTQAVAPTLIGADNGTYVDQHAPNIAADPNGGFVVSWQNITANVLNSFPGRGYGFQVYNNDLSPDATVNLGAHQFVFGGTNGQEYGGDVTVLNNPVTGITEGYMLVGGDDGPNQTFAVLFDSTGAEIARDTDGTVLARHFVDDVEQLPNGNVIVAYPPWEETNTAHLRIFSYDIAPAALSVDQTITLPTTGAYQIDVLVLGDGSFHIAWVNPATDRIEFATYDSSGTISMDGVQQLEDLGLVTGEGGKVGHPSLSLDNDGNLHIAYAFEDDGSQSGIASEKSIICFLEGTLISTIDGEKPVEALAKGDMVWTVDNGFQKIREIFSFPAIARGASAPLRFSPGSLGPNNPQKDLLVSQQHRVMVTSAICQRMFGAATVLVPAKFLVDLDGVTLEETHERIRYFHFSCENHEVVSANGALVESIYWGSETKKILKRMGVEEDHERLEQMKSDYKIVSKRKQGEQLVRRHQKNNKPLINTQANQCAPLWV